MKTNNPTCTSENTDRNQHPKTKSPFYRTPNGFQFSPFSVSCNLGCKRATQRIFGTPYSTQDHPRSFKNTFTEMYLTNCSFASKTLWTRLGRCVDQLLGQSSVSSIYHICISLASLGLCAAGGHMRASATQQRATKSPGNQSLPHVNLQASVPPGRGRQRTARHKALRSMGRPQRPTIRKSHASAVPRVALGRMHDEFP